MVQIKELDAALHNLGYRTVLRSPATNPTLLATRLPVLHTETLLLDTEPTRSRHWSGIWQEVRAAVYVELQRPGDGRPIALYATHLHHNDGQLMEDDETVRGGVRLREASALLQHHKGTATRAASHPPREPPVATFVLADFNQPLRGHCTDEEWAVVAAGLTSPAVGQPEDDGVADAFRAAGFRCAYECSSTSCNNFGNRVAPPMTHWTGTTVDFVYVSAGDERVQNVKGASLCCHVHFTPLSDHLPVVVDYGPG